MHLAEMPIAVVMQRRTVNHRWADYVWSAAEVAPFDSGLKSLNLVGQETSGPIHHISGLTLMLYRDENDGYFENWAAPEPKVFVMWRTENDVAVPVIASVSYVEGTRMLDSGEMADGVVMHPAIHEWLGAYLKVHYRPRPHNGRRHG